MEYRTKVMCREMKESVVSLKKERSENDWLEVEYKFTQNYPANLLEEAQTAAQLSGIVSHETQLSFISAVEDTNAEMERIKKEDENDMVETENRIFQNNEDSQNNEQ